MAETGASSFSHEAGAVDIRTSPSDGSRTAGRSTMKVPFLDLRVTDEAEKAALLAAVGGVLDHGRIILGPEVAQFEEAIAGEVKRKFAVGVGSGTDAMILALRAIGIGPGDEVITTPLSFIATANAVRIVGAEPVFADIGDDLTLDPASVVPLISDRTRAIVAVHWAGLICNMPALEAIAHEHELLLVEDCAQSFGARRDGRPAGSWGTVSGFSMNSMKGLASLGEAGAVACDDVEFRDRLVSLRYNGLVDREYCHYMGHNGRMDTIQAAMLLERLRRYPDQLARRRDTAAFYDEALADVVTTPQVPEGSEHAYYTYTIRTEARDALKSHLEAHGIECKIQHDPLMPLQPDFVGKYRGHFPIAQEAIKSVLCVPANEKVSDEQRTYVADCVRAFFQ